jgi:hypothetical protein
MHLFLSSKVFDALEPFEVGISGLHGFVIKTAGSKKNTGSHWNVVLKIELGSHH